MEMEVEWNGQMHKIDFSKPMSICTVESEPVIPPPKRKHRCYSKSQRKRRAEYIASTRQTYSNDLELVEELNKRIMPEDWMLHINEECVEYNLEEEDFAWLDIIGRKIGLNESSLEIVIDQLEKRAVFLSHEGADELVDEEAVCAICLDDDCNNANAILFCDRCNMPVHQDCYGVPFIPTGEWICQRCLYSPSCTQRCQLCSNSEGALKQTVDGQWVHILCILWIPELYFLNTVYLEPAVSTKELSIDRIRLRCSICNKSVGACIQCHGHHCFSAFHVTCAQANGYLMRLQPNGVSEIFCPLHIPQNALAVDETSEGFVQQRKKRYEQLMQKMSGGCKESRLDPFVPLSDRQIVKQSIVHDLIGDTDSCFNRIYNYWKLKRYHRNGVPLIRRLQCQARRNKNIFRKSVTTTETIPLENSTETIPLDNRAETIPLDNRAETIRIDNITNDNQTEETLKENMMEEATLSDMSKESRSKDIAIKETLRTSSTTKETLRMSIKETIWKDNIFKETSLNDVAAEKITETIQRDINTEETIQREITTKETIQRDVTTGETIQRDNTIEETIQRDITTEETIQREIKTEAKTTRTDITNQDALQIKETTQIDKKLDQPVIVKRSHKKKKSAIITPLKSHKRIIPSRTHSSRSNEKEQQKEFTVVVSPIKRYTTRSSKEIPNYTTSVQDSSNPDSIDDTHKDSITPSESCDQLLLIHSIVKLRQSMEIARQLCELTLKRERAKHNFLRVSMDKHVCWHETTISTIRYAIDQLFILDEDEIFHLPVTEDTAPHYNEVISHPICLNDIRLRKKQYWNINQLIQDFELMCTNCFLYNSEDSLIYQYALNYKNEGDSMLQKCADTILQSMEVIPTQSLPNCLSEQSSIGTNELKPKKRKRKWRREYVEKSKAQRRKSLIIKEST